MVKKFFNFSKKNKYILILTSIQFFSINYLFISDLRAALLSLLIHVHIDNKPRTERIIPSYTKKLETTKIKLIKNDELKDNKGIKFQNLVSDYTKINAFAKTIKESLRKSRSIKNFYNLILIFEFIFNSLFILIFFLNNLKERGKKKKRKKKY